MPDRTAGFDTPCVPAQGIYRMAISHALPKSTLFFGIGLVAVSAAVFSVKFALWNANVLTSDWSFYNNTFWNTNFNDLWLFNHDRYIRFGYPSYLNEHFAPLLLVIAALYHWVSHPEIMLLVLHGLSPVLTAIFIHATARHLLRDRRLAAIIALSYALNPGILWPTISLVYGFQPDSLLPPLVAVIGWALATNRVGVYFIAFALMLGIKENVPAYGVIFGGCLFLFTKRRWQAVTTIVVSLCVFILASKGVSAITGVQNRNIGVAWRFIDDLMHLRSTFDYTWLQIGIGLAYSTAFLPALFVWPFLAVIVPDLLLIGQVSYANTVTWHVMLPVTVLGVASVFGTARFLDGRAWPSWLDRPEQRTSLMYRYWTAVLAVSLFAGPLTIYIAYDRYIALRTSVDQRAVVEAQAVIPPQAGVATTTDLEQYFTRRRIVSSVPVVLTKAAAEFSFAVVNRRSLTDARRDGLGGNMYRQDRCMIETVERAAKSGARTVMDRGGILVVQFKRMPPLDCDAPAR